MIKIETKKIVDGMGICKREITGIQALQYTKLPILYTEGDSAVFTNSNSIPTLFLRHREKGLCDYYNVGDKLPEENFQALINFCHKAGDNLKAVNAKLKALREEWQGLETFCI